jgi:hypothetical protein
MAFFAYPAPFFAENYHITLPVSVSPETYIRKDAGFEIVVRPKAGPGADWFHVRGQVPRGRSRLASQATAKLFAEAHGKKVSPEHE